MKTIADIILGLKSRDKTATIHKTGFRTFTLSYPQLYEKIMRTSLLFKKYNLKKGDKIILWGYNSPEWGVVFLAAALKGIIVVPIDYMALQDYVTRIQAIVKAKLIIHSEYKIPSIKTKSIVLEHLDELIRDIPVANVKPDVKETDVLEIVFTSGTTGDPKGVILTHRNLISNIESLKKFEPAHQSQTFLSLLPLSHLLEQNLDFLLLLYSGCTIVYLRSLRPNLIFKVLKEERITNIILVPRLLKLFADSIMHEVKSKHLTPVFNKLLHTPKPFKKLVFNSVHSKFGNHFQYFGVGGAHLSSDLQSFWEGLGFTVFQGYGLTECSPILTGSNWDKRKIGSAGVPLPGIQLRFKDDELQVKGANITPGYYLEKKKTKDLFEDGWMRTGDLGYRDKEGFVFLKGRKKDVIITSSGVNVYPEDIEQAIVKNAEVKDACVLALVTEHGEEVHAEIILQGKADIRKIVESANDKLNESQRITSYAAWPGEDFPRTTTMKVKKREVLASIQRRKTASSKGELVSDSKLYNFISDMTGVSASKVKPNSRLALDLKLNSINRIELISMLEQEFHLDIDEEDITAETTVKHLEDMIKNRKKLHHKKIFRRWLLWPIVRITRFAYNYLIQDNLLRIFCWKKVIGRENLDGFKGPAIFIANHVGYFDTPIVYMSLPVRIRSKIAAAAWQEYFEIPKKQVFKKLMFSAFYEYASLVANIYPFPKKRGFKQSLEYTGELLDKGWNVLFFPEGEHSHSGKLRSFRPGIGWLVKEMRVPIVPIKHIGMEKIMAGDAYQWPRFGRVTVKIGKPVTLDYSKSIPEITNDLHELLARM